MKGQILDIYPENDNNFRACVLGFSDNHWDDKEQAVKVVDLDSGEISFRHHWECEMPVIENIFDVQSD